MTHDTFQSDLVASKAQRFLPLLRSGLSAHSLIWCYALCYFAVWYISASMVPAVRAGTAVDTVLAILLGTLPLAAFAMLILQFSFVIFIDRSASPSRDLWRRMKAIFTDRAALARGLPMYGALTLFMYSFTMFKANVDTFVPFNWDVTLDKWDQTLHFGSRPWEWLHPLLGNLPATLLLNVNYNLWFFVMIVSWVYFSFVAPSGMERTRYMLSFIVTWSIGGSLMAIFFSSAGPCFYGNLNLGENPYTDLMNGLVAHNAVVPIWAVDTQKMLWDMRGTGEGLSSISAMPSMHNGTSLLFVLAMWNKGLWLRRAAILHALMIFLGSIMLGWHYAVDAYVAWALVAAVWLAMKPVALWWEQRPAVLTFNEALKND